MGLMMYKNGVLGDMSQQQKKKKPHPEVQPLLTHIFR